jgi:DNA-binding XRE family transcriptional regulator
MEFRPDHKFVVARRFKALRRKAHLSQSVLGWLIDICRQSVNEIENRRVMPHQSTWDRFCDLEGKHKQPQMRLPTVWR